MGEESVSPNPGLENQPDAADALAAQKEQAEAAARTATAGALDAATADIEAGLNKEPEISLASVQPLMSKKPSELTDQEAKLLGDYYSQEAKKASEKGETFKALSMYVRAFLTSMKLDFLNPPKDAQTTTNQPQASGETPLPAPEQNEKPTPLETIAKEVEQAKGVPAILLLAAAREDFPPEKITKEYLTIIADGMLSKLGKEKPDPNNPVQYTIAYLERKNDVKKDNPNGQKVIAEAMAEIHGIVNTLYSNKEISYTLYHSWASRMQEESSVTPASAPQSIDRQVPPEFANESAPVFKDAGINFNGQMSERIRHKLGNNPQLVSWFMKCCQMFNVNPNLVASVMAVECGNEGKDNSIARSSKFHFNAVNKRTHAQGAPQAMPAYVEGWLKRDRAMMDRLPELAHARGQGFLWVRRNGQDVTKPTASYEYNMQDPYVGIFYSALFVRNHLRNIVKNGSYKHITPNWQDLNFEAATGMVYANHNMGAGGAQSFLRRSGGNLTSSGVVAKAMKYVKLYNGDKQMA